MLLKGAFSATNATSAAIGDRNQAYLKQSLTPTFLQFCLFAATKDFLPHLSLLARKGRVMAVATDGVNTKKTAGNEPSLADQLRFGSLVEDVLSYKERFIVGYYEVGIN